MARPNVFLTDTRLWHPAEGWRTFPAGETDPGAAWSEKEGGDTPGGKTVAEAAKDLIAAHDQIENLQQLLATKDASMATLAQERDEAAGRLAAAEQARIDAEKARDEAVATAEGLTQQRDQAMAAAEQAKQRVTELETDVANANQRATDAEAALAAATAPDSPTRGKKGAAAEEPGADTQAG